MKKKVLSSLLIASLTASMFAGCGSDDKKTSEKTSEKGTEAASQTTSDDAVQNLIKATEGTVTLNLWCSEQENYQKAMAGLVDEFKAAYPDVQFDIKIGAVSEGDCKDRILEDVEAAADVFVFADDQLAELVKAGALQEVASTFTYNPAETNSESTVAAATKDGKMYAYPLTASNGYFLYYDKSVFGDEDVTSWENLLKKANEKGVKVGMDVGNAWYLYSFFAGAGLEMVMQDDQSNKCNWNSTETDPTGAQVAESIKNICADKAFKSVGDTDSRPMYAKDLKAYVNGTWCLDDIKKGYGDDYGAVKLPTFNVAGKDVQMSSFAGYKLVGVNSYSKQTGWAMLLAEFITNENGQSKIGDATGEGPANINAAAKITSPALAALNAQSEFATQQVVGPKYWDPAATLGQNLVEGKGDIQKLLDTAVEGITQPAQ